MAFSRHVIVALGLLALDEPSEQSALYIRITVRSLKCDGLHMPQAFRLIEVCSKDWLDRIVCESWTAIRIEIRVEMKEHLYNMYSVESWAFNRRTSHLLLIASQGIFPAKCYIYNAYPPPHRRYPGIYLSSDPCPSPPGRGDRNGDLHSASIPLQSYRHIQSSLLKHKTLPKMAKPICKKSGYHVNSLALYHNYLLL